MGHWPTTLPIFHAGIGMVFFFFFERERESGMVILCCINVVEKYTKKHAQMYIVLIYITKLIRENDGSKDKLYTETRCK